MDTQPSAPQLTHACNLPLFACCHEMIRQANLFLAGYSMPAHPTAWTAPTTANTTKMPKSASTKLPRQLLATRCTTSQRAPMKGVRGTRKSTSAGRPTNNFRALNITTWAVISALLIASMLSRMPSQMKAWEEKWVSALHKVRW